MYHSNSISCCFYLHVLIVFLGVLLQQNWHFLVEIFRALSLSFLDVKIQCCLKVK